MKKIDAGVAATGTALVVGILIFVVFFILPTRRDRKKTEPANTATQKTTVSTQVWKLEADCFTVCEGTFPYQARIETEGEPIYIVIPNVSNYGTTRVFFAGKGPFDVPTRGTGIVKITSGYSDRQVRVRVFRAIFVSQPK